MASRTARDLHARLILSMSMDEAKEVLGFPPGTSPSAAEVAKAYKQRALENHPDRGGDPRKMVELNVAKEILDGKSRRDFTLQRDEGERQRRVELQRDIEAIKNARDQVERTLGKHSLHLFGLQGRALFRTFLLDDFADVLDLVQDQAERSLKAPASKADEKALRKVLALIKEMNGITLRIASKYRGLSDPSSIMISQLEDRYKSGEVVFDLLETLVSKSKDLNTLLQEGLPPAYDDSISIPSHVADRYSREGHTILLAFFQDLSLFDASDLTRVLGSVETAIETVLGILKARKINPQDFEISTKWKQWDVPDSFDFAISAVQRAEGTRSASRVAARFKRRLL